MKQKIIVCILMALFLFKISASTQVNDPEKSFLSDIAKASDIPTYPAYEAADLLELRRDVNGNGQPYLFLSYSGWNNGRAGNLWRVYASSGEGYIEINDTIDFCIDAFSFGYSDQLGKNVLYSYRPGKGAGELNAYEFKGTQIIEHDLGPIEPGGKDQKLYEKLFPKSQKIKPTVVPLDQVLSKIGVKSLWELHQQFDLPPET